MKNVRKLLLKRLTLGTIITVLGTFIYAIFLKFILEHYFDLYPIKGGLNSIDISYFFSIAA